MPRPDVPGVWWNWKSALFSVALKTPVFVAAASGAGSDAVLATAVTDVTFRVAVAGLAGAMIQRMSRVQPQWLGTLGGFLMVPGLSHAAELAVHSRDGTPHLAIAFVVSVTISLIATTFDLFAMRRGALIVGSGSSSLVRDLIRLPGLWCDLARAIYGRLRPGRDAG